MKIIDDADDMTFLVAVFEIFANSFFCIFPANDFTEDSLMTKLAVSVP